MFRSRKEPSDPLGLTATSVATIASPSTTAFQIIAQTYKLTPFEIAEFRDSFRQFDQDGNGRIDSAELGAVMRSLGQNPSQAELKSLIGTLDKDHNGTVEFHEFLAMYAKEKMKKSKKQEEEEVKKAFKAFDRDGDGFISVKELRHVMRCLGEKMTNEEIAEMVDAADLDGDGKIDYSEFTKVLLKK